MECYTYDRLRQQLTDFPTVFAAGHSTFGRPIWCVAVGNGGGMLVHGAIHAREHITAPVVLNMARAYAEAYRQGGLPPCDFVPMVNPDGVMLCAQGVRSAPLGCRRWLLDVNGSDDFALWKANGQGVDVNVNFDACWGQGLGNRRRPAPQGYVGDRPHSSPEARALVRLTRRRHYQLTLSYHCKGEVVYYGLGTEALRDRDRDAARYLAQYLGYTPLPSTGSAGGYKDWYILHYPSGVGLTVEIGDDRFAHPFPYTELAALTEAHRDVPLRMARYKESLWTNLTCN